MKLSFNFTSVTVLLPLSVWGQRLGNASAESTETQDNASLSSVCGMLTDGQAKGLCNAFEAKTCNTQTQGLSSSCDTFALKYQTIMGQVLPSLGGCPCFTKEDLQASLSNEEALSFCAFQSTTLNPDSDYCTDNSQQFKTMKAYQQVSSEFGFIFAATIYKGDINVYAKCEIGATGNLSLSRTSGIVDSDTAPYPLEAYQNCIDVGRAFCEDYCNENYSNYEFMEYPYSGDGTCNFGSTTARCG